MKKDHHNYYAVLLSELVDEEGEPLGHYYIEFEHINVNPEDYDTELSLLLAVCHGLETNYYVNTDQAKIQMWYNKTSA